MMILGLDIGSSSVKAALFHNSAAGGKVNAFKFPTRRSGRRVEVDPGAILKAIRQAIGHLGASVRQVDAIALSVMSPSWLAMDKRGRPLTPIITHQDRRSLEEAELLEKRIGKRRHLRLTGNRPVPGGISSTTWAWHNRHHAALMGKADLVGHLNTFLHREWTGSRVTDPSNASFMGVYHTLTLKGWCDELIEAVGGRRSQLPDILEGNVIAGALTQSAAANLGLRDGTPMMTGLMDGSCGMIAAGAAPGQLLNTSGSTDVLALCTDKPLADEHLLTRALGVGRLWLAVGTIAAAGSSLEWIKNLLFPDHDWGAFNRLVASLARKGETNGVSFDPHLAGDRTSIRQPRGAFAGLTLSTTRNDLLAAVIGALIAASARRLPLLEKQKVSINQNVIVSGPRGATASLYRRAWPGEWSFRAMDEVTIRGLAKLKPDAR